MENESHNPEPRHVVSANLLAAEVGTSGQELLDLIEQKALSPNYPTAECFLPNEVWEYEYGTLPAERLSHADVCVNCRALLSVLKPNSNLVQELRETVLQHRGQEYQSRDAVVAEPRRKVPAFYAAAAAALLFTVGAVGFLGSRGNGHLQDGATTVTAIGVRSTSQPAAFTAINDVSKREVTVLVRAHDNGRLTSESYPKAAAATAVVSGKVLQAVDTSSGRWKAVEG